MASVNELIDKLAGLRLPDQSVVRRWLIWHALCALVLIILLFWLKPFPVESSAYFWIPFVLGLLATMHYFAYRTMGITDTYVEERASALRTRSYDFDHIGDIQTRVDNKHPSVTHKSEQTNNDR